MARFASYAPEFAIDIGRGTGAPSRTFGPWALGAAFVLGVVVTWLLTRRSRARGPSAPAPLTLSAALWRVLYPMCGVGVGPPLPSLLLQKTVPLEETLGASKGSGRRGGGGWGWGAKLWL